MNFSNVYVCFEVGIYVRWENVLCDCDGLGRSSDERLAIRWTGGNLL